MNWPRDSGSDASRVSIRPAQPDDIPLVFSLIGELAEYERAPDAVSGSEEWLHAALFGARPAAEALIGEVEAAPAGFALFFQTFSTWLCKPGLWLEDLYVSPAHRGCGVGRALLAEVARIAVARDYGRVEWAALEWNAPALSFYDALGAERLVEWQMLRLSGAALASLGRGGA